MTHPTAPSSSSLEESRPEPPFPVALVEEMLRLFARAIRAHHLYLPNNPTYLRALESAKATFAPLWRHTDEVVIEVTDTQLRWESHTVINEPDKTTDALPWVLYKDGIRELGSYVQALSEGDKDIILNAGFDVRKAPSPYGELAAPVVVFALTTLYPGRIDVRWSGVKGRTTYELYYTAGDPLLEDGWKLLAVTSKNRFSATGLTSKTEFSFRVVARGAAGASPASIVATALAA